MPGDDLVFYGTTGPSGIADGNPNTPDPADWLGRYRAPNTLYSLQSTLTANQTNEGRHLVVDSARIGDGEDAHVFKWLLMQTGANAKAAARIMAFDDATGAYKLDRALEPGNAAIADIYQLFTPGNVYEDVTAAQAVAGDVRYRCIVCRNQHGAAIANVVFYFKDLGALSGSEFHRFHQYSTSANFLQRSDDQTDLFDALGLRDDEGFGDGFALTSGWNNPFGYGTVNMRIIPSFPFLQNRAIWLRRTIPAGAIRFRRSVAIQIVIESTTAGSDPDPLLGGAIIAFDIEGASVEAVLEADRYVHVQGGARMEGTVLADALALESRPVRFDIRAGDLGTIFTDDDPLADYDVTDEDGQAFATLIAPTSPAAAGETSFVQLIVGAGDEVANPRPRVTLDAATTFDFDSTATLTIPVSPRSYLVDPGAGWWPSH